MRNVNKKAKRNIIYLGILLLIMGLTIGFSAFQNQLFINDMSINVRLQRDVRVSESAISKTSSATVNSQEYNKNKLLGNVTFDSTSSYVLYRVDLTNYGNVKSGLLKFENTEGFNVSICDSNGSNCTTNYETPICNNSNCTLGSTKEIYVKVSPTSAGTKNIDLNLDIEPYVGVTYENIRENTSGFRSEVLSNSTYTLTLTSKPEEVDVNGSAIVEYNKNTGVLVLSNINSDIIITAKYLINEIADTSYSGSNPNNYVKFNNSLFRIITKENVNDGYGNTELRTKIIKHESIGNNSFDAVMNEYASSNIKDVLNEDYYATLSDSSIDLIDTASWTSIATEKIGLIESTDYTNNSSWLTMNQYTLTKANNNKIVAVTTNGLVDSDLTVQRATYPVVYLKTNVLMVSGSGTETDPYILALAGSGDLPNPTKIEKRLLTVTGSSQELVTVSNKVGTPYYSTSVQLNESNYTGGTTTIPKASSVGNYTIYYYIPAGSGYKAKAGTVYSTISGITYTIAYQKGSNVSTIGKTSDSCTTSGSSLSCSVILPSITAENGYENGKWSDGTNRYNPGSSFTLSNNNVTLTATVSGKTYVATFVKNGATSVGEDSLSCTVTSGSTCNITLPTITRNGYLIIGWANAESATTGTEVNTSTTLTGDTTFYAITKKDITGTFYYNSNTASGNLTVSNTPSACTMWNTDESCTLSIPSTVSSSVGKYNSTYKGVSTSTGNMNNSNLTVSANTTYYANYSQIVSNYYFNDGAYSNRNLYRNEYFISNTAMSAKLASANNSVDNYTTETGPGSSVWTGLSTATDTTPEYTAIQAVAESNNNTLYSVYTYTANFIKGNGVSAIGSNSATCKVYANTNASLTCNITLPSITPNTGYTSVGWSTTNGATTGTGAGQSYTVNSNNMQIYANAIISSPSTPTITGGTNKMYNDNVTTQLTCSSSTTYQSGTTKYYQFGWTSNETAFNNGSITWIGSPQTSSTLNVPSTEYLGTRLYTCRVYASDGTTNTSSTVNATTYTTMSLVHARVDFDANGGSRNGSATLYVRYGTTGIYTGRSNNSVGTVPTASKTGYDFDGWYTASTGGTKVIEANGTVKPSVTGWTDSSGKWIITNASNSVNTNVLYAQYTAANLTFNNKTITSTFNTSATTINNAVDAATGGTGTYIYAIAGGNSNNYFTLSERNLIIAANTPANTTGYQITITVTDSNSHATASATYTIIVNKSQATITPSANSKTLTYKTNDTISYVYDGDGTVSCSSSDTSYVTCSVNTNTQIVTLIPVQATSTPITITLSANAGTNYSAPDNKTISVTVAKYTPTVSLSVKSEAQRTYTGSSIPANTATVTLTNNETYNGTITYTYYTNNTCTTGSTINAPTYGDYWVKASIAEQTNYNSASSGCVNHNIVPATPTVTLTSKTAEERTYTGSPIEANTATVSPDAGGAITYKYYSNSTCTTGETSTAPTNVGTYYVKASVSAVSGKTNAASSECINHSILQAKPIIEVQESLNLTYKTAQSIDYSYDGDGVVSCESSDTTYVTCSVNTSTEKITVTPVKATTGSITITIEATAGINYSAADNQTISIEVDKFTPIVNLSAKTEAQRTFTGNPIEANTATVTLTNNETYSGSITYTYYTNNTCTVGAMTEAPTSGDYYVQASIASQANYNDASSGCVIHNIVAVTPTVSLTEKTGLVYNGSSQAANTATVSPNGGGSISYKYYTNSTCTTGETSTAPTNAGNYYVKASVSAVSGKTNAASSGCIPHTIAKKELTSNEISVYNVTWSQDSNTYTRSNISTGIGNETINILYEPYQNVVGTYTYSSTLESGKFVATPSGNTNYQITSAGNFKINAATCLPPSNLQVSPSGIITWTNSPTASYYSINLGDTLLGSDAWIMGSSSGTNKHDEITSATGSRTIKVRSNCNGAYYTQTSEIVSVDVMVYSFDLTAGTGIDSVSGSGNYIEGETVSIDATVSIGATWKNWTQTTGGSVVSTTKRYNVTVNSNLAYTANAEFGNYLNTNTYDVYNTLSDALNNVSNNQTIKVLKNVTETATATLANGKTGIKIDLNGNTVTSSATTALTNNGFLDIYSSVDGGVFESSGTTTILNNGTLTLNDTSTANTATIKNTSADVSACTINNSESKTLIINTKAVVTMTTATTDTRPMIIDYGVVNINGGSVINKSSGQTSRNDRGITLQHENARVVMTSGLIETSDNAIHNLYATGTNPASISISGGTITNYSAAAINNRRDGTVEITGGTINGGTYAIYTYREGAINISGENTVINGGPTVEAICNTSAVVTISGGTINGTSAAVSNLGAGIINITGGSLSANMVISNELTGAVTISGGTLTGVSHCVYNADTVVMTGGTCTAEQYGIYSNSSYTTVTLGANDQVVSGSSPLIQVSGVSNSYGIYFTNTPQDFNFYDGIVKSSSGSGYAINESPNRVEYGYQLVKELNNGVESAYLLSTSYNYQNITTNTYYMTLGEAFSAAQNNQTIKVLRGVNDASTSISNNKIITLDLDNKTLTSTKTINNTGTLTIIGSGTLTTSSAIDLINNSGTLNLQNSGVISNTYNTEDYGVIRNTGTVNKTGSGNIIGYQNAVFTSGEFNMSAGTIKVSGTNLLYGAALSCSDSGTATITGGTIENLNNKQASAIYWASDDVLTISGTTIVNSTGYDSSNKSASITVDGDGTVNITSGTITGGTNSYTCIQNSSGTVNISGGTFTLSGSGNALQNGDTMIFSGGTITASQGTAIGNYGNFSMTGGTATGSVGVRAFYDSTLIISGNTSITANSTAISANDTFTGSITVTGGTITSTVNGNGIYLYAGTLTIGTNDSNVSTTSPEIKTNNTSDNKYGVFIETTDYTFNFYDGIISSACGSGKSMTNKPPQSIPNRYQVKKELNNGIESAYLEPQGYEATFYYNSSTTPGELTVSTATAVCVPRTVGFSCTVTVPSVVTNSVGKYGSTYKGVSDSTGDMNTASLSINQNTSFYANYSSPVTLEYPNSTSTSTSRTLYRNEWFSSNSAMANPVLASNNTACYDAALVSPVSGYNHYGYSKYSSTNTKDYDTLSDAAATNESVIYEILYKSVSRSITYNSNSTLGEMTSSSISATGNQYLRVNSTAAEISNGNLTIPANITNSVGKYNSPYLGIASSLSSMNTIIPTTAIGSDVALYAVYSNNVTNYYYNGSEYTTRTLHRNEFFTSNSAISAVLSTVNNNTSNYTPSGGPGGSVFAAYSTAQDTIPEYMGIQENTIQLAADSGSTILYDIYSLSSVHYSGANVSHVGPSGYEEPYYESCALVYDDTSCSISLPNIVPESGYTSVGWSTVNGDTTGVPINESYTINTNNTVLYGNAILANYQNMTTGVGYTNLQSAFDEVSNNQTIKVLRDTTESVVSTLASTKTGIKLDLNGKTISSTDNSVIINNGTLDIYNSSSTTGSIDYEYVANSSDYAAIKNDGTLTLNGTSNTNPIVISMTGTARNTDVSIINGTSSNSTAALTINNNVEIVGIFHNRGTATMNGGSITSDSINQTISNSGTLTITGGTVTSTSSPADTINVSNGDFTITGGTINSKGNAITGKRALNHTTTITIGTDDSNVSITSPLIQTTGTSGSYGIYLDGITASSVNFYDGLIKSSSGSGYAINWSDSPVSGANKPTDYQVKKDLSNGVESAYLVDPISILFYVNDGTNATVLPQTIYRNIEATLNANTFMRTGYTFIGWATSQSDADNGVVTYTDQQSIIVTDPNNINLYAVWQINTYTLTKHLNLSNMQYFYTTYDSFNITYDSTAALSTVTLTGASGKWEILYIIVDTEANHEYTLNFEYQNVTGNNPLRSPYEGIGVQALTQVSNSDNLSYSLNTMYLSTAAANESSNQEFTFTATGSKTYIAFNFGMSADNETATIKLGRFRFVEEKDYNEPIGFFPTPQRNKYIATGWFTAYGSSGTEVTSTTPMPASDITYYPHWKNGNYSIGTTIYETLADAVSAVTSGQTILLIRSYSDASTVSSNKTYTLNLNNLTLTRSAEINTSGGTLTVLGGGSSGTISSTGTALKTTGGAISISGVKINAHGSAVWIRSGTGGLTTNLEGSVRTYLYSEETTPIFRHDDAGGNITLQSTNVYTPHKNKNAVRVGAHTGTTITISSSQLGNGKNNTDGAVGSNDYGSVAAVITLRGNNTTLVVNGNSSIMAGPNSGDPVTVRANNCTVRFLGESMMYANNTANTGKFCIEVGTDADGNAVTGNSVTFNSAGYYYCVGARVYGETSVSAQTLTVTKGHFVSSGGALFYNGSATNKGATRASSTSSRKFYYMTSVSGTTNYQFTNGYYGTKGL